MEIRVIKRFVKHTLAVVLYYSGLLAVYKWLKNSGRRNQPMILMYHCVLPRSAQERRFLQPGMITTDSMFDSQMHYLSSRYRVMALEEVVDRLAENEMVPDNALVLTFDDGWLDNLTCALPILTKYDVPAMIFLPTDFVESDQLFWFLRVSIACQDASSVATPLVSICEDIKGTDSDSGVDCQLDRATVETACSSTDSLVEWFKGLDVSVAEQIIGRLESELQGQDESIRWTLNWDEIARMNEGLIDFGSHGCSHTILNLLSGDEVTRELTESKKVMENKLGKDVRVFSYPNGDYSKDVRNAAIEAGYDAAVTIRRISVGEDGTDMFALERVGVHDGMSAGCASGFSKAMFACNLSGIFSRAGARR